MLTVTHTCMTCRLQLHLSVSRAVMLCNMIDALRELLVAHTIICCYYCLQKDTNYQVFSLVTGAATEAGCCNFCAFPSRTFVPFFFMQMKAVRQEGICLQ